MAYYNLSTKAEVIDITKDTPTKEGRFLVDTNVWFWHLNPITWNTSPYYQPKVQQYSDYLENAFQAGATLFCSVLSLSELAHLIENRSYDVFKGAYKNINKKEYRHNEVAERQRVVRQITSIWLEVSNLATLLGSQIDPTIDSLQKHLEDESIDGYDLFILEAMKANNITHIITDDMDFVTVKGISVFTASTPAIGSARKNQKLQRRK